MKNETNAARCKDCKYLRTWYHGFGWKKMFRYTCGYLARTDWDMDENSIACEFFKFKEKRP